MQNKTEYYQLKINSDNIDRTDYFDNKLPCKDKNQMIAYVENFCSTEFDAS